MECLTLTSVVCRGTLGKNPPPTGLWGGSSGRRDGDKQSSLLSRSLLHRVRTLGTSANGQRTAKEAQLWIKWEILQESLHKGGRKDVGSVSG